MPTHFRINYLTNLTYFPIFLHFVDFSKVAAASPQAAAAAAAADRSAVPTLRKSVNFVGRKGSRGADPNRGKRFLGTWGLKNPVNCGHNYGFQSFLSFLKNYLRY